MFAAFFLTFWRFSFRMHNNVSRVYDFKTILARRMQLLHLYGLISRSGFKSIVLVHIIVFNVRNIVFF